MKRVLRIGRKALSVGAGVIGIGTGSAVGLGEVVTGDVILDGVLILGAVIIIVINGKDGIPDWMVALIESKLSDKEKQNQ